MEIRSIVITVIAIVIAVSLVPTVWDSIYSGEMVNTTGTLKGVNGTTWTLIKLVPLIFVGAIVIGGVALALRE